MGPLLPISLKDCSFMSRSPVILKDEVSSSSNVDVDGNSNKSPHSDCLRTCGPTKRSPTPQLPLRLNIGWDHLWRVTQSFSRGSWFWLWTLRIPFRVNSDSSVHSIFLKKWSFTIFRCNKQLQKFKFYCGSGDSKARITLQLVGMAVSLNATHLTLSTE